MDPTVFIVPTPFPEVNTSPSDRPVAWITRSQFMDEPKATFLLYTGRNIIGSNPFMANVYIPANLHIDEIHTVIDISGGYTAVVQDPFPREEISVTKIGDTILRPGIWFELPEGKSLSLLGLIHLRLEFLDSEKRMDELRRDEVSRYFDSLRRRYRRHNFSVFPGPRNSQKRVSGDVDENFPTQPRTPISRKRTMESLDDENIEPTTIKAMKKPSLTAGRSFERILPPELTSPNRAFASSSTASAPRDGNPDTSRARGVEYDAHNRRVDAEDGFFSEDMVSIYNSQFMDASTLLL
ncbi:MAG: hypothetical protein J3Q66DRAFT_356118 [Benniella sp.]|nr:MAG: hypothetical protein J3Q66DRAFT_356118 [Benniella sp.]